MARLVIKGTKNPQKGQAYECGVPSIGDNWNQFNVGYYLFALIFLIFWLIGLAFRPRGGRWYYW